MALIFPSLENNTAEASAIFPAKVGFCQTTVGTLPAQNHSYYGQQNLAFHVGDNPKQVHRNRANLLAALKPHGAEHIVWLEQVHGTDVICIDEQTSQQASYQAGTGNGTSTETETALSVMPAKADGLITRNTGVALAIMTADCLPVLLSNADGTEIAAVHAGWRGLADGILQNAVNLMQTQAVYAWIGAAIHQDAFEVGEMVRERFMRLDKNAAQYFKAQTSNLTSNLTSNPNTTTNPSPTTHPSQNESKNEGKNESPQKYLADLPALAVLQLKQMGIKTDVLNACSYEDERFYSYRKNNITGRMASLIWIKPA